MSWSEELCRLCLTVCKVPITLTKDSLYNYVENHARIKIVDSGTVDGIESDRSLTRWVLLLPSEKDIQYLINEVQKEQVEVDDKSFTIIYQKAIACELPDHWEDKYMNMTDKDTRGTGEQTIPEQSEQVPNTDSFNAEPAPGQGNPAYHPQMYPGGYPVGSYGAMSGFYVNVPPHESTSTGRTDQTNIRQGDQNMSGQIPQAPVPFMQMHNPAYGNNRFGPPRPRYPHQGQIQPQNQPTSQSSQNFPQDQSHMRGPFPYNLPFHGYPMYHPMGMPQGGNIPFPPGMMQMPMIFDQHSGQFVPVSSAGLPSAPPMSPLDSPKGSADETRNVDSDPPPPLKSHEFGYAKPTDAKQRITTEQTVNTSSAFTSMDFKDFKIAEEMVTQTTIRDSDELSNINCSTCSVNGKTQEATIYCKNCSVHLCTDCLKDHNKFPMMRSHGVTYSSGQADVCRAQVQGSVEDVPKCVVHAKDVEKFCTEHDAVCCRTCIALKHRSCKIIISISKAATDILTRPEYKENISSLTKVLTAMTDEKNKEQDSLTTLANDREQFLKAVDRYREDLHRRIDELANGSQQEIKKMYSEVETKRQLNLSTLETVITDTDQTLQDMTSQNSVKAFVNMKACKNVIQDCHALLHEMTNKMEEKKLKCNLNTDIMDKLNNTNTLLLQFPSK